MKEKTGFFKNTTLAVYASCSRAETDVEDNNSRCFCELNRKQLLTTTTQAVLEYEQLLKNTTQALQQSCFTSCYRIENSC